MGLICRMWCVGLDYAKALESIVKMRIDGVTVPMRKSWKALDGTVNLMDFREDLYRFLDDSGFEFWPEEDFKEELERRARLMMAEKAQTPSERRSRFRILE